MIEVAGQGVDRVRAACAPKRLEDRWQSCRVLVLEHGVEDADAHLVGEVTESPGQGRAHPPHRVRVHAGQDQREVVAVGAGQGGKSRGPDPGRGVADEGDDAASQAALGRKDGDRQERLSADNVARGPQERGRHRSPSLVAERPEGTKGLEGHGLVRVPGQRGQQVEGGGVLERPEPTGSERP